MNKIIVKDIRLSENEYKYYPQVKIEKSFLFIKLYKWKNIKKNNDKFELLDEKIPGEEFDNAEDAFNCIIEFKKFIGKED